MFAVPGGSVSKALLALEDVSLRLHGTDVLEHVNLQVKRGEIVTLIGPNGAGKTSLVRIVLGLLKASSGQVNRQAKLRIGYMPQKLQIDASLPLTVQRFLLLSPGAKKAAALAALTEVGAEHLLQRPLQQVSGGELQRILLARALLREPDLLVLDEPVQGVDVNGQIFTKALQVAEYILPKFQVSREGRDQSLDWRRAWSRDGRDSVNMNTRS